MKEQKLTKIQILMLVGVVVIIIVVVLMMNMRGSKQIEQGTSDNASKEEIEERLTQKADPSILAATMNTQLKFESGVSMSIFNIENLPENMYDIKVHIILIGKNEEIIYESEILEPGHIIKEDQLNKVLGKGEYACIARFIGYDNEGKQVKTMDAQINIIIEN